MLKDLSNVFRGFRVSIVILFLIGAVFPRFSSAECSWSSSSAATASPTEIQFDELGRWLRKALWVDDQRYSSGTLMVLSSLSLKPAGCNSILQFRNQRLDFVYMPPPNGVRIDTGYLLPSQTSGVALKLEFPGAAGVHLRGILIGTSTAPINSNGLLLPNRMPWLNIRAAVIKTGHFDPYRSDTTPMHIAWPEGLGRIRFYNAGVADMNSRNDTLLTLGPLAVEPTGIPGTAFATACHFGPDPLAVAARSMRTSIAGSTVSLGSVRTEDFQGPGPIDKASKALPFAFHCLARAGTSVRVSFDTTYPFSNGISGVGMPAEDSDIGVQLLLDGTPVQFGVSSQPLRWAFLRSSSFPAEVPGRSVQGRFCAAECGDNSSIASASWVEGDGGRGDNTGMEALITFRYFQTTQRRPQPGQFAVPFTVTMDWQ